MEFANVILLNKVDLAKKSNVRELEALVQRLNPEARVLRTVASGVRIEDVIGTGAFDLENASQAAGWIKASAAFSCRPSRAISRAVCILCRSLHLVLSEACHSSVPRDCNTLC